MQLVARIPYRECWMNLAYDHTIHHVGVLRFCRERVELVYLKDELGRHTWVSGLDLLFSSRETLETGMVESVSVRYGERLMMSLLTLFQMWPTRCTATTPFGGR